VALQLGDQSLHHHLGRPAGGAGERHHGADRSGAHGGEIRQRGGGGLAPDRRRLVAGQEVDAFDHGIDAQAGRTGRGPDAAVIADANHSCRVDDAASHRADEIAFLHAAGRRA